MVDHFFALIPRQKNMKPSGFASCTAGALHIFWCLTSKARKHKMCFILLCAWHARGVQDTKCFIKAWRWSIVSPKLHNMKHLHFIPIWSIRFAHMMRKWKMRVYPFAIQRYPHYIMTCNPVLYGWIFLCLDFTQWMTGTYSVNSPKQRTNRERQILSKSVCFE